jgi:hypothetical protein
MTVTVWMCSLVQTPTAEGPAPAPAAEQAVSAPAPEASVPAAAPAPSTEAAPVAPPREKVVKVAEKKPKPPRAWWSTWGIVAGLAGSAVAAAVVVGGVVVQGVALWAWQDQTNANRPYADRQFATQRARLLQWVALGLLAGGVVAFFGGLVGATYAFGLGNPDPKSVKDL